MRQEDRGYEEGQEKVGKRSERGQEKARDDVPCLYRVALLSQRVPLNLFEQYGRKMKMTNRPVKQNVMT
jgi:hypothetical protein